jgi:3'-phosphoadenosine 5'-phosphosulfate sulfotransferase (PAPS reductase)/FAD synthetase
MAKHTSYDLAQMQSLPLEAKIIMTKQRIKAWYESWIRYEIVNGNTGKTRYVTATEEPPLKEGEYINSEIDGQVYVSFSGGKDSTVLKHIVDSMYDDVPALFVNTGLEYPEIQKFAMSQNNVITVRPKMRFDEVLKTYGYPVISKEVSQKIYDYRKNPNGWTKDRFDENSDYVKRYGKGYCLSKWVWLRDSEIPISNQCCNVMKKQPAKFYEKECGRKPIIATMAVESRNRKTAWLLNGCNAFEAKRPTSQPLSFWTEQDILEYIRTYNIPYCSVYGDIIEVDGKLKTTGCDRTGCIFCMFGCHLEKAPNRFQRLKETHPRQYEYCIGGGEMVDGKWQPNKEGLGLGKVLDYIGVDYE